MKTYKSKDYCKYDVIVLTIFALLAGNTLLALLLLILRAARAFARFLVRVGIFEEVER